MPLHLGREVHIYAVPRGGHSREHRGTAVASGMWVDPCALESLPCPLEQEALLRVHRAGLAGTDREERRIELASVVDEPSMARVRRARMIRIGVEQAFGIPAAIRGEL
jgi:hypothetical protein